MLADSPVLYLRLGEPSGTNANDETANNNDGTYVNSPTLGVSGALVGDADTAVTFDPASSQHVTVADHATLDFGNGPFSLEAWYKPTDFTSDATLIDKGGNAYRLTVNITTGTVSIVKEGVAVAASSTIALTAGAWNHIVVTRSGASGNIYINGLDVTGAWTDQTFANTTDVFAIGRRVFPASQYARGGLDEVAAYPSALSAARVLYHYEVGTGTLPGPPSFKVHKKPPLELHAELVAANGTRYRWAGDRTDPRDVPSGISFASKRFEGFERGSGRLNRPVDRDYPDLGLFDSFTLVGYDASVAYEGMLGQVPRSTPFGIGVETTGWMAHARHRKFREIYVDRDLSHWQEPTLLRRAQIAIGGSPQGKIPAGVQPTGLTWDVPLEALAVNEETDLMYSCPPGLKVAKLGYQGARTGTWTNLEVATLYTDDREYTFAGSNALTLDDTIREVTVATPARYGMLRVKVGTAFTPTVATQQRFSTLAVYGDHSVPPVDIAGEPDGFYVSDLIADICSRFCPKLNTAGVQGTTWPVPQAAWLDRTDPYDAWLELNKYHLWELAVWEGRTLNYGPSDLSDYDWEVRTSDPAVTVELQGDSTDHLANYAVVQFVNARTGTQDEVSPDTHPELEDTSTENPANRNGLQVEFGISLTDPTDPDSAAQIGVAALAENNQPAAVGTITFKGHIRDRAGHWQQGWKVRAGDTVAITDWPNNRPRLIGEMQWDHDTKTGTIAVDSTLRRVDAFLDRYGTALRAHGL